MAIAASLAVAGACLCTAQPESGGGSQEAIVAADPVPAEVPNAAVLAVQHLGEQVLAGHYKVAIDRMNPQWKERTAARLKGMKSLEMQLEDTAAQMTRLGIAMVSFKPAGQPRVYQVTPGYREVTKQGKKQQVFIYTKWLVFVPTVTIFRVAREGMPKATIIESQSYQVAVADKGKSDWTFIDGSGLNIADLRGLYGTLPADMELPPVLKREIR